MPFLPRLSRVVAVYGALLPIMFCGMPAPDVVAQTQLSWNAGAAIELKCYAAADPMYGATYRYSWSDIRVGDSEGNDLPAAVGFRLKSLDVGYFNVTSDPITVPPSGMVVTLTRSIEVHPTDADCGTTLWTDPLIRWPNAPDGAMRVVVLQSIDVIDAATNQPLGEEVDRYRIGITRNQVLLDSVVAGRLAIDLTPFAGRSVAIRARVTTVYGGRGPSTASEPAYAPLQGAPTVLKLE